MAASQLETISIDGKRTYENIESFRIKRLEKVYIRVYRAHCSIDINGIDKVQYLVKGDDWKLLYIDYTLLPEGQSFKSLFYNNESEQNM